MKKIFVFIMILLSFRASHQESIIINDSAEEFSVERVSGLYKIKTNRITYTQKNDYVFFNSFNFTNEIGLPKLPAVRIPVYSYSPDVKVTALSFKGKTNISLENPVFPVQRPRQKQSEKQIFDIEEKFYFSSQEYPSNVSSVVYAGYERGLYVSVIEIFPVRYNPGNNTITIYDEIDIEVSGNILFGSLDWDSAPSKYLIVTKDDFLPYISDFADFKARQGFFVEFLNTDTIGVLNSDIKDKIQSLYDTSFIPLRFVLLAGDVDVIPNFTGTEMDNPPTDLYYSLLSGSDYIPDVYIGRFPSSDTLSLRTMSQKSIMFEKAEWAGDDSWANKAYLMASDDPSFHLVAESTQIYAASKLRSEFMEVDSMFDYYSSGTQVSAALNDGRSIVVYSGHGSYTAWAGPSFSQADIENLTNGDMIPIVSSYACLTGNYALPYDCFGETWVKKETGGAVSYMGSSVYSYWDEDDYMERSFFDALSDSGWMVAGKLMNAGKFGVFTAYSGGGLSKRYYEMYNILGDPSLGFYTGVKDTLKISVMNPLPEAASELEVTVYGDASSLPVENVLVSLSYNQSLYAVSYTDSFGKVLFSNPGFSGDTLFFTASKPSYRQGESFTVLTSSQFYPFVSKTLFSDTIFSVNVSDLSYSPLDTGSFDIMVKNLGESGIISLQCSLATTGSLIDFKSYTAEFSETIGIGDSSWVKVPLISFVKEGIRNNSRDTILFFMRDADDSAVIYKKQIKIFSPEIIINSPEYSFSEGISSGDTVKMTVRAINVSATDDRSISLKFFSNDTTLIQFIDSTSDFDFIGGFDTLTSDTMSFFVSSEEDSFFTASFTVFTGDTFGIEDTFDFSLSFNKKDYLVLDYSKDNLSALFIDSILGELGYSGSYALSVDVGSLGNYKNIFMSAGEYPNNRVISAGDSVAAAIDSLCREGKLNLYLEGGEMWFWDLYTGQGYDFQPLTKIDGRVDGDMLGNFEITGEENSIGEGISITYDGGISADVLDTLLGAKQVFFKGDTLYAASYRDPLYKTVGSSLCVGSLVDADSVSSRKEWVRRIMLFFEGLIGVNELSMDSHLPEFKFISMSSPLSSNEFRIFYTAIRGEEVAFKVYNSAGMEVFSKKIPALASGLNSFTFNVSENNLASGVYFIRADNSKKSFTKKIAVIR